MKITYPSEWNFFNNSLPAIIGYDFDGIEFELNNDCNVCDLWIVWGNLNHSEKISVSSGITVFIAEEAYLEKIYPPRFLDQFNYVFATRNDILHPQFKRSHYTGTWFIKKSYLDLCDNNFIEKSKDLSVISSNLTLLDGHKKRYAFVNRMIGHFKDKLDVYGRGYNEIDDKAEGLSSYKYSIAIENSVIPDYFTEKIWDCYLSNVMPFYYGCPNLEQYFPSEAFIRIDINDYKKSIDIIEEAIETDVYFKAEPSLLIARNKVLYEYTLMPFLMKLILSLKTEKTSVRSIRLNGIGHFEQLKSNSLRSYLLFK